MHSNEGKCPSNSAASVGLGKENECRFREGKISRLFSHSMNFSIFFFFFFTNCIKAPFFLSLFFFISLIGSSYSVHFTA